MPRRTATFTSRLVRFTACAIVLVATGCTALGPASINSGRSVYNEAIAVTNDQELLSLIVRTRYDEGTGLLMVSAITANVNVRASAGANFGIGPDENYIGNLVPLSTGIAYEENPTISYVPVDGERYIKQLLSPLPMDLVVLLLDASDDFSHMMMLLLDGVNGIQNPDFLRDPSAEVDGRFARITELIEQIDLAGALDLVQEPGDEVSFAIHLSGHEPGVGEEVRELYDLLGLDAPAWDGRDLVLPLELGLGKPDTAGIRMKTRSVWDLIRIACAAVEVPEEDVAAGRAKRYPPLGRVGAELRFPRSKKRPKDAMVAVRHHGWWYYVDATDGVTKQVFRIVSTLMSVRIADTADRNKGAPVLTIPASG